MIRWETIDAIADGLRLALMIPLAALSAVLFVRVAAALFGLG